MRVRNKFHTLAAMAVLALALPRCGGGGGGSTNAVRPQSPTGGATQCSYVVSESGALKRVDSDGATADLLSSPPFQYALTPSLSLDRLHVVFSGVSATGTRDIWICSCDGTGLTQVTRGVGTDINPDWSPDGTQIAFQRGNAIYKMAADGTSVTRLTDQSIVSRRPRWARGSGVIIFSSKATGTFEIWKMDANGDSLVALTFGSTGPGAVNPEWVENGTAFVFERSVSFSAMGAQGFPSLPGDDNPRLYKQTISSGAVLQLTGATTLDRMPVYYGEPRMLVVTRGSLFYRIPVNGGAAQQLF